MKQNIDTYRLTSDVEPSDELLAELMHEVAIEVKEKAEKSDREFQQKVKKDIEEAMSRVSNQI